MPQISQFGDLLRRLRHRSELRLGELASFLHVKASQITAWEKGRSIPPLHPELFTRFREVPGFTDEDFQRLVEAAALDRFTKDVTSLFSQLDMRGERSQEAFIPIISYLIAQAVFFATLTHREISLSNFIEQSLPSFGLPFSRLRLISPLRDLTKSLQHDVNMVLNLVKGADSALVDLKENPLPNQYPHTSVPDHARWLVDQEKPTLPKKGVVFDIEHAKLLVEALENPDHALRQAAEQLVQRFGVIAEKAKSGSTAGELRVPETYEVVATLQEAAEKTGIPIEEIVTTKGIKSDYGVNRSRIQEWKRSGPHGQPHLTELSIRLKGKGGSDQLLFWRKDVESVVANPPKPGRPWKKQEEQPAETSEHLMTLDKAAEMSGIPRGTLANYISDGVLTRRGRLRSPAPGGGKVLVDPDEVRSLPRRPRGRPKKNSTTK